MSNKYYLFGGSAKIVNIIFHCLDLIYEFTEKIYYLYSNNNFNVIIILCFMFARSVKRFSKCWGFMNIIVKLILFSTYLTLILLSQIFSLLTFVFQLKEI